MWHFELYHLFCLKVDLPGAKIKIQVIAQTKYTEEYKFQNDTEQKCLGPPPKKKCDLRLPSPAGTSKQ